MADPIAKQSIEKQWERMGRRHMEGRDGERKELNFVIKEREWWEDWRSNKIRKSFGWQPAL